MIDSRNLPIILEYLFPDLVNPDDYMVEYDKKNDLHKIAVWNNNETQPDDAAIDAAEPLAIEAAEIERLTILAEETALIHGSQILDPVTGQPAADPTLPIDEIRKQTGQSRVNLVDLKKRGDANGKAKANKAQGVEEDLALEVVETVQAIQAKTVTTDQEVIDRIKAVVITY